MTPTSSASLTSFTLKGGLVMLSTASVTIDLTSVQCSAVYPSLPEIGITRPQLRDFSFAAAPSPALSALLYATLTAPFGQLKLILVSDFRLCKLATTGSATVGSRTPFLFHHWQMVGVGVGTLPLRGRRRRLAVGHAA